MNKGVLLFAHNSQKVNYGLLALVSGSLAKKNLSVPVSVVTDKNTLLSLENDNLIDLANEIFDNIIVTDNFTTDNVRVLSDGHKKQSVPFINSNRSHAWDLTPYQRTLLIDVDYLILSSALDEYWDSKEDFLISKSFNDIYSETRISHKDRYISEVGVHMFWATTIMFTKNENSKIVFDLVKNIKENYQVFSTIYQFNSLQYRNDISFSIAKHIVDGYETNLQNTLPPVLTVQDKDMLVDVNSNNFTFLINDSQNSDYVACSVRDIDVHVMNKIGILRNAKKILGII